VKRSLSGGMVLGKKSFERAAQDLGEQAVLRSSLVAAWPTTDHPGAWCPNTAARASANKNGEQGNAERRLPRLGEIAVDPAGKASQRLSTQ